MKDPLDPDTPLDMRPPLLRGKYVRYVPLMLTGAFFAVVFVVLIFGITKRFEGTDSTTGSTETTTPTSPQPAEIDVDQVAESAQLPTAELPTLTPSADPSTAAAPDDFSVTPEISATQNVQREVEERRRAAEIENRLLGQLSSPRSKDQGGSAQAGGVTNPQNPASLAELSSSFNDAALDDSLRSDLQNQLLSNLGTGEDSDQNRQKDKLAFINTDPDETNYLSSTRIPALSPYELKAGSIIPGILISSLNSDLPGSIIGQVSQHVFDSATGQHVLIPQGSRLFGIYDSRVTYGQRRALVVWSRVIFPDGSSLNLENMQAGDKAGYIGLDDRVKSHFSKLIGHIFLLSAFQSIPDAVDDVAGSDVGGGDGESTTSALEQLLATNLSKAGEELTKKQLGRQPTIIIRSGYKFAIMVNKDIIFPNEYLRL